jgi:hypothetical protein
MINKIFSILLICIVAVSCLSDSYYQIFSVNSTFGSNMIEYQAIKGTKIETFRTTKRLAKGSVLTTNEIKNYQKEIAK